MQGSSGASLRSCAILFLRSSPPCRASKETSIYSFAARLCMYARSSSFIPSDRAVAAAAPTIAYFSKNDEARRERLQVAQGY